VCFPIALSCSGGGNYHVQTVGFAFADAREGIYTVSKEYIISGNTPAAPTTAYAREKLRQEESLKVFAGDGKTILHARIYMFFGTAQPRV
jgi:hypothetical protein